jgi:hypothetical protein
LETDTLKSLRLGLKLKVRDLGIETIAGEDDGAKKALRLVEQTDFEDDEFLFMNLMEAHGPYKPPSDYDTTNPASRKPSLTGRTSTQRPSGVRTTTASDISPTSTPRYSPP